MIQKYSRIKRTDQNIPRDNSRKDLISSKDYQIWAIIADFSPCKYEVDGTRHILIKQLQNQSFRCQNTCEIFLQMFPQLWKTRKIQFKTWPTHEKKLFPTSDVSTFIEKKVKKNLYPIFFVYLWKTFEQQVKDIYASQKVQVFSRLRRTETHFRHQQSRQRADPLTGSIYKIQNTNVTVNGVKHQKTVNKKNLENGLIVFQKQSEYCFIANCGRTRPDDAQFMGKRWMGC